MAEFEPCTLKRASAYAKAYADERDYRRAASMYRELARRGSQKADSWLWSFDKVRAIDMVVVDFMSVVRERVEISYDEVQGKIEHAYSAMQLVLLAAWLRCGFTQWRLSGWGSRADVEEYWRVWTDRMEKCVVGFKDFNSEFWKNDVDRIEEDYARIMPCSKQAKNYLDALYERVAGGVVDWYNAIYYGVVDPDDKGDIIAYLKEWEHFFADIESACVDCDLYKFERCAEVADMTVKELYAQGLECAYDEAHIDLHKAFWLFSLAARQNDVLGIYMIGAMYEEGRGVMKDEREARRWFDKLIPLGTSSAKVSQAMFTSAVNLV